MLLLVGLTGNARAQSDGSEGAVPSGSSGALVKPAEPAKDVKKPVVVMPKLVHFEHAAYPAEAEKAGLEASVTLKLTIDREGKVTAAAVAEAAGHGFDEAARGAALKFQFDPATRDGVAIPVQILYRYSFTLTPKAAAPVAPPPAPTGGNLSGTLRIAGTNTPLVGASIDLTLPDGQKRRVTSDAAGKWRIEEVPAGTYRVHIEGAGFQPLEEQETVVAGEETQATYQLAPVAEGIEITVRGERPPREVTRRTIERREIERIPGTSGDALRSLQSLPGVARPPGLAGLLIVRGSAPNGTGTYIDGSQVGLIYHFGGLSSVVPTELLERIDFYPGNFGVRYGRVMGGIVDVGLKSPDTRCYDDFGKISERKGCYHGLAQIDLIDARLIVQGPLGPFKDWGFTIAGRRSWVDVWLKPVLEQAGSSVTSAPVYYDYQLMLDRKKPGSHLSFRAFGSDDRLELIITDPAAQDPGFGGNLTFGTSFYRGQILYEGDLSPAVSVNTMLSAGKTQVDLSLGNFLLRLETEPVYLRHEFGFRVAPGIKINAGLDFFTGRRNVIVRAPDVGRPGEPDPGPFATRPPRETHQEGALFRPAWYADAELQPTARLRVVPGIRLDYARDSGHADISPRVVARYDLVSGSNPSETGAPRRRTTLKGGIGLFYEPPQFQETDPVFGTPNLRSNRAVHYSIGVEQELTRQVEVSVEGFYKSLTQQVSRTPDASGAYTYNNNGSGSVIGLETLLKYKPDKRFFGWLAYTLSRSVRRDSPNTPEYLFQYDQTHNLIVLGSYRLGRGWEFGARFRIVSGPLDTPVLSYPALPALYAADAGAYAPLQGQAFSRRLPLFHQLDMRIDKRWQFRNFRLSTYLDVQNVYNNPGVEALVFNYNFSKEQFQTGIPIIPSLGVRGEF